MTALRLAGRTIGVTRPKRRGDEFAKRLEGEGARVVRVPLVEIGPAADDGAALRAVLRRASEFDWVIVTSANAVDAIVEAAPSNLWRTGPSWAAVGPATADRLESSGVAVALVASRPRADVLGAEFPVSANGEARVLLIQAEQPRLDLSGPVRSKGWTVERVSAYRTTPTSPCADDLRELRASDAITLASPSAAVNLAHLGVRDVPVVCIGEVTAESARAQGLQVAASAAEPGSESFLHAVVAAVGLRR